MVGDDSAVRMTYIYYFRVKIAVFLFIVWCEKVSVQPSFHLLTTPASKANYLEDTKLNFTELSQKYGHPAEEYAIVTEDEYILTLFHIPGPGCPVFLQHGVIDSADTFIIRGNSSLAITLAEAGYDVWIGNMRGNKYSKKHKYLNSETDEEYWDFSMHEIGNYDIPAMIDFILDTTRNEQLIAIGHSLGNAVFYVLGSSKPEYNDKIKVLIALAPIAYLSNVAKSSPYNIILPLSPLANTLLKTLGIDKLFERNSIESTLIKSICSISPFKYEVCVERGLFYLAGADTEELERDFIDVVISHFPSSTSRKNAWHLAQIVFTKRFQRFDYGEKNNYARYGRHGPPEYDLNKVTMKVELLTGRNDKLSTVEDVKMLNERKNTVIFNVS